ncbi:glycosyltransferase family 4 protein [Leptospira vanthielii]|uniref:Glycosyltransferase, group 1 family protein n=1 Tax=Leptospira vanthielii serovar Holland str. Waz Holland = ATCC 700522 TaxID=1218591 RepID=N1W834_9LEPT|nr:glycosyltransferase family 1 protein [Leptospira vanthielii]EMY69585.1 glycosyltransferase, group 1 family protein [Leptospira vanthielii serovar Holland str. Waz Holland = ATCC 700522]
MKILFDHQIFFQNKYGGISKIFFEIFKRLNDKKIEYTCSVDLSSYSEGIIFEKNTKKQINRVSFFSLYSVYKIVIALLLKFRFPISDFILNKDSGVQRFSLSKQIKYLNEKVNGAILNNEYTVFHPTYYHRYFLPLLKRSNTKLVLTIHDCVHEIFPEFYGSNNFILRNREILSVAADKIVCVSHSTKADFLRLYSHIPEKKVSVIYNAGDLSNEPIETPPFANQEFLLFVGNRGEYKNFFFLLKAFSLIVKKKNLYLVCAGGKKFSSHEKKEIKKMNLEKQVVHVSFSSETILANLYRNAKLFIYPSLYEGFGIPLLEAMSVGCPVFCSQINVFKEVAGDAAAYFDPLNHFALSELLVESLNSTEKLNSLRVKGFARVQNFSWEKCADSYLKIYEELSKV